MNRGVRRLFVPKSSTNSSNQSPGLESDDDPPSDGLNEGTFKKAWEEAFEHNDFLLLGSHKTAVELYTIHPEAVQIFQIWQIFLDNVNPLLKVIHAPSMQARIIDAASNLKNINPTLEALMFSIYCMSITSLSVDECQTKFGSSKDILLAAYQHGCQQALLNSNYLRSTDRNCLTALYLYLVRLSSPSYIRFTHNIRSQSEVVPILSHCLPCLGLQLVLLSEWVYTANQY
jgi:hypothetical protein